MKHEVESLLARKPYKLFKSCDKCASVADCKCNAHEMTIIESESVSGHTGGLINPVTSLLFVVF